MEEEKVNDPTIGTADARVWAEKFCKTFHIHRHAVGSDAIDDPEGLMLGWFANAIMAGRDTVHRESDNLFKDTDQWEDLEQAVMQSLGAASGCWSEAGKAGTFQSDYAVAIGHRLLDYITNHYRLLADVDADTGHTKASRAIAALHECANAMDALPERMRRRVEIFHTLYVDPSVLRAEANWIKKFIKAAEEALQQ